MLNGIVLPWVNNNDLGSHGKVKTNSSNFEACKKDLATQVSCKSFQSLLAGCLVNLPVVLVFTVSTVLRALLVQEMYHLMTLLLNLADMVQDANPFAS